MSAERTVLHGILRSTFMAFVMSLGGLGVAQAKSPTFLGMEGQAKGVTQDALLKEIQTRFDAPVNAMGNDVKAYTNYQIDGSSHLNFGLIVEPLTERGKSELQDFVRTLENVDFHGFRLHFQKVRTIIENVTISTGMHQPGSETDQYDPKSEVTRTFTLSSVQGWESFTDRVGDSFQSKNSADFQGYLTSFLGGTDAFQSYANRYLAHDNVTIADLSPTLILEGGTAVDQESGMSPFFDMPFVRNCWDAGYENGMCYRP